MKKSEAFHEDNTIMNPNSWLRPEKLPDESKLIPYGWARGGYVCKCSKCDRHHMDADKRSSSCQECALKLWEKNAKKTDEDRYVERLENVQRETQTVLMWNERFITALLKNGLKLSNKKTKDYHITAPSYQKTETTALMWPADTYIVEV